MNGQRDPRFSLPLLWRHLGETCMRLRLLVMAGAIGAAMSVAWEIAVALAAKLSPFIRPVSAARAGE
jgi:hypothetical protein